MASLEQRPIASASAPGKVILLGEHSVVYGRAAIAVPVRSVLARACVWSADEAIIHSQTVTPAGKVEWTIDLSQSAEGEPLATAVHVTLAHLGIPSLPRWRIELHSSIPLARGLGSSAAVAVACIRALAQAADRELSADAIAALAYEAERTAHGTPSGIDNTVIAWDRPIFFAQGKGRPLKPGGAVDLVIADSGFRPPTHQVVALVRTRWEQDRTGTEAIFDAIHRLVLAGQEALSRGDGNRLGQLMRENHLLLCRLGVSDPRLDHLVSAAMTAGASGAKLSGAGKGGVVVAAAAEDQLGDVARAMLAAGAVQTIVTRVEQ